MNNNFNEIKMLREDFFNHIVMYMDKNCNEGEKAKIQYVTKNNGVILPGLIVKSPGRKITPTIYLNSFYEDYMRGKSIEMIEYEVLKCYRDNLIDNDNLMDFFAEYEAVKRRICYKVISKERNADLLGEVPYIEFLDLAVVFFYSIDLEEVEGASVLIKNSHLTLWGIDKEALIKDALYNTPRLYKPVIRSMKDIITQMMFEDGETSDYPIPNPCPMYVVTNQNSIFGASVIFYSDLSKLFPFQEKDYYILPSSIHELIILPAEDIEDVQELRHMVQEVNCTQVPVCDILSDNVYYYSYKDNSVKITG